MSPNLESGNAYEILGVPRDASLAAIRRAFKKLALKHHPDMVYDAEKAEATRLFSIINQAHEVLRDSNNRKQYDHLLSRGVTPDLTKYVEEGATFESLADILGAVRALDIYVDQDKLLKRMDSELRMMLTSNLVRSDQVRETVIDAIVINSRKIHSWIHSWIAGSLSVEEEWLIITELRLVLLKKHVRSYQKGNVKHTEISYSGQAFPYMSMANLEIHEHGRARSTYKLEVEDEDKRCFRIVIAGNRLTRLLVVANVNGLPLKARAIVSREAEVEAAIAIGLAPVVLWCLPFLFLGILALCAACTKQKGLFGPVASFPRIYTLLTDSYVTTAALYACPLLLLFQLLRVHKSWNVSHPDEIFGPLALDYALGIDSGQSEKSSPEVKEEVLLEGSDEPDGTAPIHSIGEGRITAENDHLDFSCFEEFEPKTPSASSDSMSGDVAPARPPPIPKLSVACPNCSQLHRVPVDAQGKVHCSKCGDDFLVPSDSHSRPAAPAAVAMPDSVREALGASDSESDAAPAPSPSGEDEGEVVACPSCGQSYVMPPGARGTAQCSNCGQRFRVGD